MKSLYTIAAFAITVLTANATLILVDNLNLPSPVIAGAQSTYAVQSFTPSVAGIGTSDTVAANSPLPATIFLGSAEFLRGPSGTADAGQIFIDVYEGAGNTGTYIGSSSNSIDVNNAPALSSLAWTFDGLGLNGGVEHALVFSSDAISGSPILARLTAANNGGGFVNTYDGGTAAFASADNSSPLAFDARFLVTLNTIPEPSSMALFGLGGLALILRRLPGAPKAKRDPAAQLCGKA